MLSPIKFLQDLNPFSELTYTGFGTWVVINAAALYAIVNTKRPSVVGASLGAMIGSFGVAWQRGRDVQKYRDEDGFLIFVAALISAGLGAFAGQTYSSYLADLTSSEEIGTRPLIWD